MTNFGRYPTHDEYRERIDALRGQQDELLAQLAATERAGMATIEELQAEVERLRGREFTREELVAISGHLTCHSCRLWGSCWAFGENKSCSTAITKARAILEATDA